MFGLIFDISNNAFDSGFADTEAGEAALPLEPIRQFKPFFDPAGGVGFDFINKIRNGNRRLELGQQNEEVRETENGREPCAVFPVVNVNDYSGDEVVSLVRRRPGPASKAPHPGLHRITITSAAPAMISRVADIFPKRISSLGSKIV